MTPEQRRIARHALGLRGVRRISFRNFFIANQGCLDLPDLEGMVSAGAMIEFEAPAGLTSRYFKLTRSGAQMALEPDESLDPEDFPDLTTKPTEV